MSQTSMILRHNDKLAGAGLISRGIDGIRNTRQFISAILSPTVGPQLISNLARAAYRYNTIRRQATVPPNIQQIATICSAAYIARGQRPSQLLGAEYNKELSSDEIAVYVMDDQWIIAVRGTVTSAFDMVDDLAIAAGGLSADSTRVNDLLKVIQKVKQAGARQIVLTGHSLAGAVCSIVTNITGIDSINFNIGSSPLGIGNISNRAQQHIISGDPISNTALGNMRGAQVVLYNIQKKHLNAHTIEQFK